MTDPVTFGALAVQALAWIGTEMTRTTVGEATKEAIKSFKQVFAHTGGAELVALEADPTSQDKQRALAQKIDAQPDEERENLRAAVMHLLDQLKAATPVGMKLDDLSDVELKLRKIEVKSGRGMVLKKMKGGKIEIDELSVGTPPGK